MNNKFVNKKVAEILLAIALISRRPPVMRNVRAEYYIRPRGVLFAGKYYKVVEE